MRVAFLLLFLVSTHLNAQNDCVTGCDPLWLEVPFGGDIGTKNAFIKYDFDKDGELDIITFEVIEVDESHNDGITSARNGSFLYAMKYNVNKAIFEKIYITDIQNVEFSHMARGDINNDGKDELVLTVYNDLIYIYDLETLDLINCRNRSWGTANQSAYELKVMDIDADGRNEILVNTLYEFHIYDSNSMVQEFHADGFWGDFEVGNIDNDPALEIVLSNGTVYEPYNQSYRLEYELNLGSTDLVELWDIDGDGNKEVIIQNGSNIVLYDVESSSLLYENNYSRNPWIIADLERDGSLELLILDDFWQDIGVYNLADGNLIYELDLDMEPYRSRLFSMMVHDFNRDNIQELMLTFDDVFGEPGGIRIYNLSSGAIEHDTYGEMGAFHALELEDIDGDGNIEIISASGVGPGYGNDYAHINIFDAATRELELRLIMPENVSLESRHIEVSDFGSDGDLDIIVLAENFPNQNLIVFDGRTGDIEHDIRKRDLGDTRSYILEDIDEDGEIEILACSPEKLRILNANDLSIKWESFDLDNFYDNHTIITGDIDSDPALEIVMSKEWVYRFDDHNNAFTLVQSAKNNYRAVHLFDWNNDGTKEILAGTTDGLIDVLNATNMDIIDSFKFSDNPISAIFSGDLEGDGIADVIVTSMDQLYIHRVNRNTLLSQVYGIEVGEYDGLKVRDINNDGNEEIFVGSWYGLIEVDKTCTECFWVDFSPVVVQPSCYGDKGWIVAKSGDPTSQFTLNGITITDTIKNLEPGTYNFTVTNELGCRLDYEVRLDYENDFQLDEFEITWKDPVCGGDGIIYVETLNPDLIFSVDGQEIIDSIDNLFFGNHEVFVSNKYGCFKEVLVELEEPVIPVYEIITSGCGPHDYKYIDLYLLNHFQHDPEVYWNDELVERNPFTNYEIATEIGIGTLEIRMNECSIYREIEITPIDPSNALEFDLTYFNIGCEDTEALVIVGNVKHGQEPYYTIWDGVEFFGLNFFIEEGTHVVELRDATGCSATKFFEVFKEPEISYDLDIEYGDCQNPFDNYAIISNLENVGQSYSIIWNGVLGDTISSPLNLGTNSLRINYGANCSHLYSFIVDDDKILEANIFQTENYCDDNNLATVEIEVEGGATPLNYSWSDNVSDNHIAENLYPGIYWVTVTDANNCQSILSIIVENQELSVDLILEDILCHGDNTGSIQIEVNSGQEPYTYFINGNLTTQYVEDLEAGSFEVSVIDTNGCRIVQNISLEQPEPLTINAVINPDTITTTQLEGSIDVTVLGGVQPYEYFWTTGSNENQISEISNGVYFFSVTDLNGCVLDSIFTVGGVSSVYDFEDFNISLFPNPAQQVIYLESTKALEIDDMSLYSFDGRKIDLEFDDNLVRNSYKIDLGIIENGVYVLALTIADKTVKHQIVVLN